MLLKTFCGVLSILSSQLAFAAPVAERAATDTGFWMGSISRQGKVAYGSDYGVSDSYTIFRDITKAPYNADSSGASDVTDILNNAIADGDRCGLGCDSSTVTPAIIYFPSGTYKISKPLQMKYYTQMIGDAINPPTIIAADNFEGMALLDSDPYENDGTNWFTNQNNFFRQVRNFVIDITPLGMSKGAAIHWQVAQATSLQNIRFEMVRGGTPETNKQIGIFMDNGSGGFMSDLTFNGGGIGAFLGSQQFTTRNMTFDGCQTGIFMNWNWGWTIAGVTMTGVNVGIDMSNSPSNQTVGSVLVTDSSIIASNVSIATSWSQNGNVPNNGGQLILQNVSLKGAQGVTGKGGNTLLSAGDNINFVAGAGYNGQHPSNAAQTLAATRPATLLNGNGAIYTLSKPQYADRSASDFVSAKTFGLAGDGVTDDTAKMQQFLTSTTSQNKIAFFDHGAYLVKDTITVPAGSNIVGEIWSLIVADGASFSNTASPKPVWQVGNPGDKGNVQIQDLVFETAGPAPGAIIIQWNLNSQQGSSGMWDSHVRLGGSAGTDLQWDKCAKNENITQTKETIQGCEAAFLMFYAPPTSGGLYLENTWFWVADHELDQAAKPAQISLYNGRGVLIESSGGPTWLWGSASEHSILYNYQFNHVKALFSGFMQSETPYMQPNPDASVPFAFNSAYDDPTFTICNSTGGVPCKDSWGLRIMNSQDVLIYGTGLYSFFNNYDQTCVAGQNCQQNMVRIMNSQNVQMYDVSTKASVRMLLDDQTGAAILDENNRSNFCATFAYYWGQGTTAKVSS